MRRHSRQSVEDQKPGNRQQEQRAAIPASCRRDDRDGRRHRAERIERHSLPGHGFQYAETRVDLRQKTGGHVLGHDGEKPRHRERQQLPDRQTLVRAFRFGAIGLHVFGNRHGVTHPPGKRPRCPCRHVRLPRPVGSVPNQPPPNPPERRFRSVRPRRGAHPSPHWRRRNWR